MKMHLERCRSIKIFTYMETNQTFKRVTKELLNVDIIGSSHNNLFHAQI